MANTPVLNFERTAFSNNSAASYPDRLENDRVLSANQDKVDAFSGLMTGSTCLRFFASGSAAGLLATDMVLGVHYTRVPMVYQEIVAFASHSGSGGVTSIDIQQQETVGGAFQTIFANAADRPNVSASLGNYGVASTTTFRTGSLAPGLMVRAVALTAAGDSTAPNAQRNITVQIFWKPSGSYGT